MVRFHHAAVCGVVIDLAAATVAVNFGDHEFDDKDQIEANLSSVASAKVISVLETFSDVLFDPTDDGKNVHEAMKAVSGDMDLHSAMKVIDVKSLPKDVSHLVQRTVTDGDTDGGFAANFDENSLEKARVALNELVEKAWIELDDKIFKCKGFQDMNRNNYGQVTRDIMRLIEQINDLERIESEALEGIVAKEQEITDTEELLSREIKLYNLEHGENAAELTIRNNDLDVFQFILVFTKCKDATSLSQFNARVCETKSGRKTLLFKDTEAASKYKSLLTPAAKRGVDRLLRSMESQSFVQQPGNATTPPVVMQKEPVLGEDAKPCITAGAGGEDECMKSCGPDPPDCALLHDKLSLMWGDYKDKVDELTMEMTKNRVDFVELKANLNSQIQLLVTAKARFQMLLAEARANLAADRTELKEKYVQKSKLDKQYIHYMTKCKKRIQWIMYQDMCAIKVVRNAVLENSTRCPSATIMDCDMDGWIKASCSVSCDDKCDPNMPFKCGGWAQMSRGVVAMNDKCGIRCPLEKKLIRCGQYHCPVNCLMSSWSGFSKCTADCEGGLQSQTRSIIVKPKNGGGQCNTVEESRPCNTQSCDRDCKLQKWTSWTPCSVACGGGFQEATRHVLIPTRGEGKCPRSKSRFRYKKQLCNIQKCVGDEVCIAKQDVVIAVDGSGSVQKSGFDILKKYTATLLKRYKTKYFGQPAMRVGIVLFGNGVLVKDPKDPAARELVSPAINKQKLTGNLDDVLKAVEDLPFKKGFTNMAQAFSMAEDMFVKGSRKDAQHSVMLITDGKPSFAFMTNEMVEQLDDKGIMRYFVVVNNQGPNSDAMKQMQKWASQPWETNLVHVQGLVMLDADMDMWAEKALTKFCPMAFSASVSEYEEKTFGYAHIKDSAWCGVKDDKNILSKNVQDVAACAALAVGAQKQSFLLGAFFRRGWCIGGTMAVDSKQYKTWQKNKEDPACPDGWKSSMLFDFYAFEPDAGQSGIR